MAIRDQVKEALTAVVELRSDVLRPQVHLPIEAKELAEVLTSSADKIKPDAASYFASWPPQTLPTNIQVKSGNKQPAPSGQVVSKPLEVSVTDASGSAVPNVLVQFVVPVGSGSVIGGSARTDSTGTAALKAGAWRLGRQGKNLLKASTFAATGPIEVEFEATAK